MMQKILFFIIFMFVSINTCWPGEVKIQWEYSAIDETILVNGNGGYTVYAGTESGNYIWTATIDPASRTYSFGNPVTNLTVYVAMTAYAAGVTETKRSDYSNELLIQFPLAVPTELKLYWQGTID